MTQALDFGDFEISNIVAETDITRQEKAENDASGQRFANPVSDEEVKNLVESKENVNTKKNTKCAFGVWQIWRDYRIKMGTVVPEFREMNKGEMNFFMGRFMLEARKQDGSPYPLRSLYLISCGLLRYLRDCGVYE